MKLQMDRLALTWGSWLLILFWLFTWLNGRLRVDLESLVHDSYIGFQVHEEYYSCSYIIAGIQVGSPLHFFTNSRILV